MRNMVDKRLDEFKILKPKIIEVEYEYNTESIFCKDWGIDSE